MKKYAGGKTPFELFSAAVDRRDQDDQWTKELLNNKHIVNSAYDAYEAAMDDGGLYELHPVSQLTPLKNTLRGMYSSHCKLVKDFRRWYFDNNPQTYYKLCPYCVINSANTTDHILPKDMFPEYSLNVHNLIPVCSQCNSFKGEDVFDNNGDRFSINFYTDVLPHDRFLFASFTLENGLLRLRFHLMNNGSIDATLFSLIERHYSRYKLLDRYFEKAVQELPSFVELFVGQEISTFDEYDRFAVSLARTIDYNASLYGQNHWRIVMQYDALHSPEFRDFVINKNIWQNSIR